MVDEDIVTLSATSNDAVVPGACFDDWKRFCFALREIANGDKNHRPLSGREAQRLAQAVLTECGYTWPGRAPAYEAVLAPTIPPAPAR
jgi:hypothetical protein